jgi:hypothetical protein
VCARRRVRCGGLVVAAPGWRDLIGGRVWSGCPGGRSDPLWTFGLWLSLAGVERLARMGDVAGPGEGVVAACGGVRVQSRTVAGPSWRTLAAWPGFLTG